MTFIDLRTGLRRRFVVDKFSCRDIVNEFVSAALATGVFSERLGLLVDNTS